MLLAIRAGNTDIPVLTIARMKAELGRLLTVIAAGGPTMPFEKHTNAFDIVEPDLTIQELAMPWERATFA